MARRSALCVHISVCHCSSEYCVFGLEEVVHLLLCLHVFAFVSNCSIGPCSLGVDFVFVAGKGSLSVRQEVWSECRRLQVFFSRERSASKEGVEGRRREQLELAACISASFFFMWRCQWQIWNQIYHLLTWEICIVQSYLRTWGMVCKWRFLRRRWVALLVLCQTFTGLVFPCSNFISMFLCPVRHHELGHFLVWRNSRT